nr:unnamed protein product [Spirometra erinaceieuropaei]
MDSQISSLVAKLVLQMLEKVAFDRYEPAFWRRYVDDTFVIIGRSTLADFQDLLNGFFSDTQFTREEEHAEELAFLDVLVTRTPNGDLSTTVYGKATNTTQIHNYHKNVSEAMERITGEHGVGIAHRPTATMHDKIMRVKDRQEVGEQSGVVYQTPCRDGPSHYIGQTGRRLSSRITEHKRAVRRGDPLPQFVIHALEEGHEFNFLSTRIVARPSNKTGRELLEGWAPYTNSINGHVDIPPPSAITRCVAEAKRRDPISSLGCRRSRRRETAWDSAYREYHPLQCNGRGRQG